MTVIASDNFLLCATIPFVYCRYSYCQPTVCQFQNLPALMADFDFETLSKNPFFMKKFRRCAESRDTNKDGLITRSDFDLTVQRHMDMGAPEHKVKELRQILGLMSDSLGLTDHEKLLTYQEFGERWAKKIEEMGKSSKHFAALFRAVDTNDSGEICYNEWVRHYKAMGIDPKHARASFDAMDANGDGKVSKQEFIDYHCEYFYTTDDKLKSSLLYGPLD